MSAIRVYNKTLSPEFCRNIINMFEAKACCKIKHGNDLTYKLDPTNPDRAKMIHMLNDSRNHFIGRYFNEFPEFAIDVNCGGYEVTRYNSVNTATNFYGVAGTLSALWFLNSSRIGGLLTINEDGNRVSIKPEVGKLIIFPSTVKLERQAISDVPKYLLINNMSEAETPA